MNNIKNLPLILFFLLNFSIYSFNQVNKVKNCSRNKGGNRCCTSNRKKVDDSKAKFIALTDDVDMNKTYDSFFMCPPTYKKVQEGYSDEKGNLFNVDNNTLLLFIEWFIGYNPINNIWTDSNSSYMSSKGESITTTFYFMSKSTGKMTERINTYDYSSLIKEFNGNFNLLRNKYDYSNQSAPNYWGNLFFIRKIFTDYYDDYLVSPK